ncbi:MAG: hypothetical protein GY852_10595, partial [bacterium]|nr:hypothetical protein [bacterium]
MNLSLDLSMKLQQKLSFQMIQSLKLLQVNTLQLEQMLKTELEMNPVLEETEELEETPEEDTKEEDEKDKEEEDELEVGEDEIDWEEYLEEGFDLGYSRSEEFDPNQERFEPTAVHVTSLEEQLNNQLAEKKLSDSAILLVRFIIGSLEEDGYLRLSLEQIAEATKTSIYEVEEALNIVWNMEPAGLGARNLQECMMLQLRRMGRHNSLAMRIISEQWELFEKLKIPDIAHRFGVDTRTVQ